MGARGTEFAETLTGQVRLAGEESDRSVRLDLEAGANQILRPRQTVYARLTGQLVVQGWREAVPVSGELMISPLVRHRIWYRLEFQADGRDYTLEGWKSVSLRQPIISMTRLPFSMYLEGKRHGSGELRFQLQRALPGFLASFRFPRLGAGASAAHLMEPRWDGTPGRIEVWYTTLTDPRTGTGVWLHHELTAPADGSPAQAHGWIAVFPPGAPVQHARFGPETWKPGAEGFATGEATAVPGRLSGSAGSFHWDLTETPVQGPLFTFPRWSWRRELLPAAQILPAARSVFGGTITWGDQVLRIDTAPGASARIYGHGYARRWAWLHADLGSDSVLEIVSAVSTRPLLDRLPPLVFLRLRRGRSTWPRLPLRAAVGWIGLGRFRSDIGLPRWTVQGWAGLRRIRVEVTQPPARTLTLDYHDPGGAAVCHNTEAADAVIILDRWLGRWRAEATWDLRGTVHAEVGSR